MPSKPLREVLFPVLTCVEKGQDPGADGRIDFYPHRHMAPDERAAMCDFVKLFLMQGESSGKAMESLFVMALKLDEKADVTEEQAQRMAKKVVSSWGQTQNPRAKEIAHWIAEKLSEIAAQKGWGTEIRAKLEGLRAMEMPPEDKKPMRKKQPVVEAPVRPKRIR